MLCVSISNRFPKHRTEKPKNILKFERKNLFPKQETPKFAHNIK